MKNFKEPIKAVIFDCDGVLVDSEIIASQVSIKMLKPLGFDIDPKDYARIFAGKVEEDIMEIIRNEYGITIPEGFLSKLRLEIEHGLDHELQPIRGAREAISNITVTRAVVSNSRLVRVIHSLKVAGLTDLFGKRLYAAEMVERPKPDPSVYLHAAKQIKVNPSACVVVEDSLSGVTAAYRAGMNVIGFLGASHIHAGHDVKLKEAGAFTTVNNMQELKELLQKITME